MVIVRRIGRSWTGEKYVHGPRLKDPRQFSKFRLGKPTRIGERQVFGKKKGTSKWMRQSTLVPVRKHKRKVGRKSITVRSHKRKIKRKIKLFRRT